MLDCFLEKKSLLTDVKKNIHCLYSIIMFSVIVFIYLFIMDVALSLNNKLQNDNKNDFNDIMCNLFLSPQKFPVTF